MADREMPMSDWLESELFRRRTLRLTGALDDEAAGRIAAALMTMDAEGDDVIDLHISSATGSLDAALVLIDTIDLLGVPVRSTALGAVDGPAAFVLALSPRRRAAAHASVRLAQPELKQGGRVDDLVRAAQESGSRMQMLAGRLAEATRRSKHDVAADLERGRIFTAAEALEAGLVDEVVAAPGDKSSE